MICSRCNRELPITEFPYRNKKLGTHRTECKDCNRSFQKDIYDRNVLYINNWKAQGCKKCGNRAIYLIDAHHIDPALKDNDLCRLKVNCSIERIQAELDKCIPLCANCHREFHHLNETANMTIEEYLATEV